MTQKKVKEGDIITDTNGSKGMVIRTREGRIELLSLDSGKTIRSDTQFGVMQYEGTESWLAQTNITIHGNATKLFELYFKQVEENELHKKE